MKNHIDWTSQQLERESAKYLNTNRGQFIENITTDTLSQLFDYADFRARALVFHGSVQTSSLRRDAFRAFLRIRYTNGRCLDA